MDSSDTFAVDQRRQNELVITTAVFTTLSVIIVSTRTFVRSVLIRKFGPDDATILVALLFCVGYLVEVLLLRENGAGHAITTLSMDNMLNLIKVRPPSSAVLQSCVLQVLTVVTRSRWQFRARTTSPSTLSSSPFCSCSSALLSPLRSAERASA